ncbi:MAG: sigma-70 family RNA polymerase sigma factor [Clostridia bacterium]|nr:sigma-70 family RNA polymerase sigma factor [Clostridia bacterium]
MNDPQYLNDLCTQFYEPIRRFCLHMMNNDLHGADDITSDVFYLLMTQWERLDFASDSAVLGWLHQVARNFVRNYTRKKLSAPMEETLLEKLPAEDEPSESLDRYHKYIFEIEQNLSMEERLLFHRLVVDRRSYSEISEMMGVSVNALRLRLHRIREKIAKRFPGLSNHNL